MRDLSSHLTRKAVRHTKNKCETQSNSLHTYLENLLDEVPNQRERQTSELVLLEQLVQVDAQQLEHEAEVVLELKAVVQPHYILGVVRVVRFVQLYHTGKNVQRRQGRKFSRQTGLNEETTSSNRA